MRKEDRKMAKIGVTGETLAKAEMWRKFIENDAKAAVQRRIAHVDHFHHVNTNTMADSSETKPASAPVVDDVPNPTSAEGSAEPKQESHSDRKRKRFQDDGLKFGRGGKKRDMGRNAWS